MFELKFFVVLNICVCVLIIVLEEIGVLFEIEFVCIVVNQQNLLEFLKFNLKGKVLMLFIDGVLFIENVVILSWLNVEYLEVNLFFKVFGVYEQFLQMVDLFFFLVIVYLIVIRVVMLFKFIEDKVLFFEIVRLVGIEVMNKIMIMIDVCLVDGFWWYGDIWLVVDGYLCWVWGWIIGVGYLVENFLNIWWYFDFSNEWFVVQWVMVCEVVNIEILKFEGFYIVLCQISIVNCIFLINVWIFDECILDYG